MRSKHSAKPAVRRVNLVRFAVAYKIRGRTYNIVLHGISAAHIRSSWDRRGSEFMSAVECDSYGLPT